MTASRYVFQAIIISGMVHTIHTTQSCCTAYNDTWAETWRNMSTSRHPNERSSCPWSYVHGKVTRSKYAENNCIDLHRSNAQCLCYTQGQCQPLFLPNCPSHEQKLVGYYCVLPVEIAAVGRRSNVINEEQVTQFEDTYQRNDKINAESKADDNGNNMLRQLFLSGPPTQEYFRTFAYPFQFEHGHS